MSITTPHHSIPATPLKRPQFDSPDQTLIDTPIIENHKRRRLEFTKDDEINGIDAILNLESFTILGNVAEGKVATMGDNTSGQLGILDIDSLEKPKLIDLPPCVQVVCGGMSSYAISLQGKVWSWGCNDDGALGRDVDDVDEETIPNLVNGLQMSENHPNYLPQHRWNKDTGKVEWIGRIVQLVAGDSIVVVLCENGKIYSCGTFRNQNGLYGFSPKNVPIKPKTEQEEEDLKIKRSGRQFDFVQVEFPKIDPDPNDSKFVQIACGANHCLALDEWGRVFSWGCGEVGVLGRRVYLTVDESIQTLPDGEDLKPDLKLSLVPGLVNVPKAFGVYCGGYHSIVLTEQGPFTFGLNNWGQLGIGSLDANHLLYPHQVKLNNVIQAGGGEHFTTFLTRNGQLYVCGNNESQQLGRKIDENKKPTERIMTTVSPEGEKHVSKHKVVLQCLETPTLLPSEWKFDRIWCGNNYVFASCNQGIVRWGAGHLNLLFQSDESDMLPSLITEKQLKRRILDVGTGGQHVLLLLESS